MCLTRHHVQYLKIKIIYLRKNYKLIQTRFSYEQFSDSPIAQQSLYDSVYFGEYNH